MNILGQSSEFMIERFGETVTVRRYEEIDDPLYPEDSEEIKEEFEKKVRFYDNPDEEELQSFGFDQSVSSTLYTIDDEIEIGDEVEYNGAMYGVSGMSSQQMGSGDYRFIYSLQRQ